MMSPMFVPKSIRMQRFGVKIVANKPAESLVASYSYIEKVIKRVVVSEKYIVNPCVLALDVDVKACKQRIARAFAQISPDNNVVKITSLINKSTARTFKGKIGATKASKRLCIRFDKPFDISLIYNTDDEESTETDTSSVKNITHNIDKGGDQ